jgi:rfaE bifunctional protein nucleotidyltransferase chain/domain
MKSKEKILQKIKSRGDFIAFVEKQKAEGKKIVFTNGCFDIVHPGHVHYLMDAAMLGDVLVIAVNTDQSVQKLKGLTRPLIPEEERCLHLASFEFVDAVTLFDEETPENLIRFVKPDVLVKGNDYTIDQIAGANFVLDAGGQVITLPLVEGYSTTKLIEKLKGK